MVAEALMMATTVWYVPGWMRTEKPREDVMTAMTNAFPDAKIEFKHWDGDRLVWPLAVESADRESWRFAFEAAMMPKEERENLVIVGHSLGGRITARIRSVRWRCPTCASTGRRRGRRLRGDSATSC